MKFLNDLDLNKNEAKSLGLELSATDPASPVSGQVYFNTTDNNAYLYDGSSWNPISGGLTNLDGGTPTSVYTSTQNIDGGSV